MKKLCTILALILLVAISTQSYAQTFGIRAGLNIATVSVKDDDGNYSDEISSKVGLQLGPVLEFPLGNLFVIETGILFSNKGANNSDSGGPGIGFNSDVISVNYIDIPVNFKIEYDVSAMRIYGNLGPYVAIATTARMGDEKMNIGSSEDDDLSRTDIGLNIGAGAGIRGFEFGLNYGLGLTSIIPYDSNGLSVKTRVFSVIVAYKFGKH